MSRIQLGKRSSTIWDLPFFLGRGHELFFTSDTCQTVVITGGVDVIIVPRLPHSSYLAAARGRNLSSRRRFADFSFLFRYTLPRTLGFFFVLAAVRRSLPNPVSSGSRFFFLFRQPAVILSGVDVTLSFSVCSGRELQSTLSLARGNRLCTRVCVDFFLFCLLLYSFALDGSFSFLKNLFSFSLAFSLSETDRFEASAVRGSLGMLSSSSFRSFSLCIAFLFYA